MWSYVRTRQLLFLILINEFLIYSSSARPYDDHSYLYNPHTILVEKKSQTGRVPESTLWRSPRNIFDSSSSLDHQRLSALKSPVYRMKFGSGRLSQFHHVQPPILNSYDEESRRRTSSHLNDDKRVLQSPLYLTSKSDEDDKLDSPVPEQLDPEWNSPPPPSFTPYISARALSNIGKFFEHLQENLLAIQNEDQSIDEIGQPSRRRLASPVATLTDETLDGNGNSGQDSDSSESLETVTGVSTSVVTWPSPSSRFFRWSSHNNKGHGSSRWSSSSPSTPPKGVWNGRIQGFIDPLPIQEDNQLKRTNYQSRYNPSWTSMGLGRR